MITLQQLLQKKKIQNNSTKVREFLSGKRARVVSNRSGAGICVGDIIVFDNTNAITVQYYNTGAYAAYYYDLELISLGTTEEIDEEISYQGKIIKEATNQIVSLESRKKFMKANKLEVFDEDQFKVYQILQTLKDKKTDLQKAEVISKIVKG